MMIPAIGPGSICDDSSYESRVQDPCSDSNFFLLRSPLKLNPDQKNSKKNFMHGKLLFLSLFCFSHFMRKYFTYWVTSIIYEFVTVKDMIGIL